MRLKAEFQSWILGSAHSKSWLIQTEKTGAVTQFKHYHMHIQIGPAKKQLPLTSILLLGHESLVSFCAKFVAFSPTLSEFRALTSRFHEANMSPRRIRLRVTCLQPIENDTVCRGLRGDLYHSLFSMWWGFEDVQISSAIDKEAATQARKQISGEKWDDIDSYLDFVFAHVVTTVIAISQGDLVAARQLSAKQRFVINIMNDTAQLVAWTRDAAAATQLRLSMIKFLLIDMEVCLKFAQASKSENIVQDYVDAARAIHDELAVILNDFPNIDQDTIIQGVYLLSICYRYSHRYYMAAGLVVNALKSHPKDRRLQREQVILNILTKNNLCDQDLRQKADEFRMYPIEQQECDAELAQAAKLLDLPFNANGWQQDFIAHGMRAARLALANPSSA